MKVLTLTLSPVVFSRTGLSQTPQRPVQVQELLDVMTPKFTVIELYLGAKQHCVLKARSLY